MLRTDQGNQYRFELKYRINAADHVLLRARLRPFLQPDPYASARSVYTVRSLYFDNDDNASYLAKLNGERERCLYRIRLYNNAASPLFLERKRKSGDHLRKERVILLRRDCDRILRSRTSTAGAATATGLLAEFLHDLRRLRLAPAGVIDYEREAYHDPHWDLRVTFDRRIGAAPGAQSLFRPQAAFRRLFTDDTVVLEIKFGPLLPSFIPALLAVDNRPRIALSKYALGRQCLP